MTSTDFLEKVYGILNDQKYRISFSPVQKNNWMMDCNGDFIGGIFDGKLYFVHTNAASKILDNPEPIFRAQHKMLAVPIEIAREVLRATYEERYDWKTFIFDISFIFAADSKYPDHILGHYELFVIFLRFCYEKKLFLLNPLDKQGRILHMKYTNGDLTENGKKIFADLNMKWLAYTDRTNKIDNIKMLEKYYSNILREKSGLET
jgi:hypothetical protein